MSETFDPRRVFAPGVFDGTTALVTGAGRGIGEAIAVGFAELGADVVLASNEPDELQVVGEKISALGRQSLEVDVNIRDVASVEALRDAALARFGSVDFVINNAGGQFQAHPFAISDNGWRSVIDLNLNGTWNMCSRFMPHLMERGRGSIVNIVHIFCFERGAPMFVHSGAARAGVVNLTRSLAPYLEERNVTINALAPGVTVSPAAAANYGFTEEEWRAQPSTIAIRRPRGHGRDRTLPLLPGGTNDERQRGRRRRRRNPEQLAAARRAHGPGQAGRSLRRLTACRARGRRRDPSLPPKRDPCTRRSQLERTTQADGVMIVPPQPGLGSLLLKLWQPVLVRPPT